MTKKNYPKHVEFYCKYKFEKLVHLVGFIIRIVWTLCAWMDGWMDGWLVGRQAVFRISELLYADGIHMNIQVTFSST